MQRKKEEVKPREVYVNKKDLINSIVTKRPRKKFLTDSQKEYYDILCKNQITICSFIMITNSSKSIKRK